MKKKYTKNNNLGGWVVDNTTHSLEIDLIHSFKNSNYVDFIYLLTEKGYTYQKELNDILIMVDSRNVIKGLLSKGIIEEFILDEEKEIFLSTIKGINKNSLFKLRPYRLTNTAKVLLQNPYIYKLLCSQANLKIKYYIEHLKSLYEDKIRQIEQKKQDEQEKFMLRYRIAKSKNENIRTSEDWAIIDMVESVITYK